jgi:uncharacterized protein (DUF983 family)
MFDEAPSDQPLEQGRIGQLRRPLGRYLVVGVWVFAAGLALGALYLTTQSKTPTESALSAILLTFISVVLSWILAHYYATATKREEISQINQAHEKSLRMYALKAAEKVMNLSRELDRLSNYLVAYRDAEDDENLALVLRSKDERVTGAIHIVAMLRSVNDTALSDWEGVIGAELDKKREEEKEEREEYLDDLILKVDQVVESVKALGQTNPITAETLRKEFHEVRSELITALLGASSGKPSLPIPNRRKQQIAVPCPACESAIRVRLSAAGKVRVRGYRCSNCKASLVSNESADGSAALMFRAEIPERVKCPDCGTERIVELDNLPGVAMNFSCRACGKDVHVHRSAGGVGVRLFGSGEQPPPVSSVTPEFVSRVRLELPAQPWPTGIHKKIAERLSVAPSKVQKAIRVLILSGIFKHQVDGTVVDDPTQFEEC